MLLSDGIAPELSVAVGTFHVAMALFAVLLPAWTVMPEGQFEMAGGVLSITGPVPDCKTFTKKVAVAALLY